jgi:hypothetical protein
VGDEGIPSPQIIQDANLLQQEKYAPLVLCRTFPTSQPVSGRRLLDACSDRGDRDNSWNCQHFRGPHDPTTTETGKLATSDTLNLKKRRGIGESLTDASPLHFQHLQLGLKILWTDRSAVANVRRSEKPPYPSV